MKIENDDSCTYICDHCNDEIVDAPLMCEGFHDKHFCTSYCALKWTCRPVLATVNGHKVMP